MHKTFFTKLAIAACALVLAFGLAEVAVRLIAPQETGPIRFSYHADLGEMPLPGQQGRRLLP